MVFHLIPIIFQSSCSFYSWSKNNKPNNYGITSVPVMRSMHSLASFWRRDNVQILRFIGKRLEIYGQILSPGWKTIFSTSFVYIFACHCGMHCIKSLQSWMNIFLPKCMILSLKLDKNRNLHILSDDNTSHFLPQKWFF